MPETKKQRFPVVDRTGRLGENAAMRGERGNIGIFVLTHLLVAILVGYHTYCGRLLADFKYDRNRREHVFYRWLNELPVIILIGIVILAVVKPF